jgi:hypothetical protein
VQRAQRVTAEHAWTKEKAIYVGLVEKLLKTTKDTKDTKEPKGGASKLLGTPSC